MIILLIKEEKKVFQDTLCRLPYGVLQKNDGGDMQVYTFLFFLCSFVE